MDNYMEKYNEINEQNKNDQNSATNDIGSGGNIAGNGTDSSDSSTNTNTISPDANETKDNNFPIKDQPVDPSKIRGGYSVESFKTPEQFKTELINYLYYMTIMSICYFVCYLSIIRRSRTEDTYMKMRHYLGYYYIFTGFLGMFSNSYTTNPAVHYALNLIYILAGCSCGYIKDMEPSNPTARRRRNVPQELDEFPDVQSVDQDTNNNNNNNNNNVVVNPAFVNLGLNIENNIENQHNNRPHVYVPDFSVDPLRDIRAQRDEYRRMMQEQENANSLFANSINIQANDTTNPDEVDINVETNRI